MNPSDTLSGAYGVAKIQMPDGSEVPVMARKVMRGDGTCGWAIIDDAVLAFEQRFQDTETRPNDFVAPNTSVLDKKLSAEETTTRLVAADLIQFLGDPDRIIAQKGLDEDRVAHMRKHPASLTMARRLCSLAGPKWREALRYLPQFYPETKP